MSIKERNIVDDEDSFYITYVLQILLYILVRCKVTTPKKTRKVKLSS